MHMYMRTVSKVYGIHSWPLAAIETTAIFKLGPRPLDDHSLESVLDEEVKAAYQALSEEVKKHVSLLIFSLLSRVSKYLLQQV